ncbi:reverse transcriptase domain-containing protein [Tanacetum coccineum]
MGVKNLQANVDSRLVANQVNGTYVAKETDMIHYLEKVITLTNSFKAFSIRQVPRKLKEKSISEVEILAVVEEDRDTWMTPIFKYLAEGIQPADVKKAWAIRHKFGLPKEIISNNGKQFRDDPFKDWCKKLYIRQTSADQRPRRKSKSQLRRRNKRKVGCKKQELDGRAPSSLEINLDLLEERRGEAEIREVKSKAKMEKYYNSKVRNTSFKPGDLVYRNNDASQAEDTRKLGPKWEGPYEVTEVLGKGAYI